MICKICDNSEGLTEYSVKEMMFGFRDEFKYFQCEKCNCLQIYQIPQNISKYYPDNYYSFAELNSKETSTFSKILKKKRNRYAVFRRGLLGKILHGYKPNIPLKILSEIPIAKNSKILDVGCGNGSLLIDLSDLGFNHLTGIDPYISEDIYYDNGVTVYKKEISDVGKTFDIIMFHHSFEHLANPLETLNSVSNLLEDGGYCIVRVPTASSYAWRHYKEDWVQLDAPRHFFLHSKESINILASKSSLKVDKVVYDSTEFQFTGSERYLRGIPLKDDTSNDSIFTRSEISRFKKQAKELNIREDGDACAFILRKA